MDVSWAGPMIRCEQALKAAGEAMEFRRWDEASDHMRAVQVEYDLVIEAMLREVTK